MCVEETSKETITWSRYAIIWIPSIKAATTEFSLFYFQRNCSASKLQMSNKLSERDAFGLPSKLGGRVSGKHNSINGEKKKESDSNNNKSSCQGTG